MASPAAHCIESLHFEAGFPSAEEAFESESRVAEFARTRAPRIIDEVFEQFASAGQVWRFDALEIDLGHVPRDDMERTWEARLREQLSQVLEAHREAAAGRALPPGPPGTRDGSATSDADAPPVLVQDRAQAQLETLLHFLRRGHLPWHAPQDPALASPIEQLAHEVLRDAAGELVARWRASPPPEADLMVRRASRQFPPAWLARLAQALAGSLGAGAASGWGREAPAWIDGFERLWRESGLPSSPPPALLWQGLLSAMLSDVAAIDRSQPFHSMVQALAPDAGEQAAIWRALRAVARRAIDGTPPAPTATLDESVLRTCLAARVADDDDRRAGDAPPATRPGSREDEQARLLLRLQAWLAPQARGDDAAAWHELLRAEPSWARRVVLQLGRTADARRRMARGLPAATLHALAALWLAPSGQDVLRAALSDASLWGRGSATPDVGERWELTLSHVLLHPSPALFDARDYLDDMIQRRAERENRPVAGLLRELSAQWREGGRGPGGWRDVAADPAHAAIVAWLRSRLPAERAAPVDREARRLRLEAALRQGVLTGAEEAWAEAIDEDADWLQDLVRRVGRRPGMQQRIARDWDASARAQLIGLWLPAHERAAVIDALHDPAWAALAGEDGLPAHALWEDLLAHLLHLTAGTFFNADAYLRGLSQRLAPRAATSPATPSPPAPDASHDAQADARARALPDVVRHLLHGLPPGPEDAEVVQRQLQQVIDARPPGQREAWLRALESPEAARRLAEWLPPRRWIDVMAWLRPAEHREVRQATQQMHAACRQVGTPAEDDALVRLHWRFACRELFEEGRRFEPAGFALRLARHLAAALRPADPRRWLARLADAMAGQVPPPEGPRIASALAAAARAPEDDARTSAAARGVAPGAPVALPGDDTETGTVIRLDNAGMVLAGAYLQRLWGMLGLLADDAFASPAAAERAVHLLQYLVTGSTDAPEAPEAALVLNKVLCGLPLATPVARGAAVTPQESAAVDGLLQAMISHWKIIGSTSVAGLRESFLQREGHLRFDDEEGWRLVVQPRSFDMLLDQLPWGYGLQKLPWMERSLHVEWR